MPGNDWKHWMWRQVRWWWPWLILALTFNMKISKATVGIGGWLVVGVGGMVVGVGGVVVGVGGVGCWSWWVGWLELVGWVVGVGGVVAKMMIWQDVKQIIPGFLDIHLRFGSFFIPRNIVYIYMYLHFHIQVEWSRWLWKHHVQHTSELTELTAFQRSCMGEWGWDCWKWHWWWWQWPHGMIGARCGYKTQRSWFSMVYYGGLLTLWYGILWYVVFEIMDSQQVWKEPFPKHHFKSWGTWRDDSRGFVDDVNGFNFVDAWPMIQNVLRYIILSHDFFGMISRWAPKWMPATPKRCRCFLAVLSTFRDLWSL